MGYAMNDDDTKPSERPPVQPPEMPPQPKTKEIPAANPLEIALAKLTNMVQTGFVAVEARLDSQDTKLDKAITEGIEANVRLDRVETRMGKAEGRLDTFEERLGRTSTGVRGLSSADSKHDAELAQKAIDDAERDRKIAETHALAAHAAKVLQDQSDYMGMGKRGAQWLFSKEGRTAVAQLVVAIVAAYEGLKHTGVIK